MLDWGFVGVGLGLTFLLWGLDKTGILEGKGQLKEYSRKILGISYFIIGALILVSSLFNINASS